MKKILASIRQGSSDKSDPYDNPGDKELYESVRECKTEQELLASFNEKVGEKGQHYLERYEEMKRRIHQDLLESERIEEGTDQHAHKFRSAICYAIASIIALTASYPLERIMRYQQAEDCSQTGRDNFWRKYTQASTVAEKREVLFGGLNRAIVSTVWGKTLEFFLAVTIADFVNKEVKAAGMSFDNPLMQHYCGEIIGFGAFNAFKYLFLYPRSTVLTMHQIDQHPDYLSSPRASNFQIVSEIVKREGFTSGVNFLFTGSLPGLTRTVALGVCYPTIRAANDFWAQSCQDGNFLVETVGSFPAGLLGAATIGMGVGGLANFLTAPLDQRRVEKISTAVKSMNESDRVAGDEASFNDESADSLDEDHPEDDRVVAELSREEWRQYLGRLTDQVQDEPHLQKGSRKFPVFDISPFKASPFLMGGAVYSDKSSEYLERVYLHRVHQSRLPSSLGTQLPPQKVDGPAPVGLHAERQAQRTGRFMGAAVSVLNKGRRVLAPAVVYGVTIASLTYGLDHYSSDKKPSNPD